jgi:hypothetical protein
LYFVQVLPIVYLKLAFMKRQYTLVAVWIKSWAYWLLTLWSVCRYSF